MVVDVIPFQVSIVHIDSYFIYALFSDVFPLLIEYLFIASCMDLSVWEQGDCRGYESHYSISRLTPFF